MESGSKPILKIKKGNVKFKQGQSRKKESNDWFQRTGDSRTPEL